MNPAAAASFSIQSTAGAVPVKNDKGKDWKFTLRPSGYSSTGSYPCIEFCK